MRTWLVAVLLVSALAGCSDDGDSAAGETGTDTTSTSATTTGTTSPGPGGAMDNDTEPEPVRIEVALTGAYPVNIAYDPADIEVPAGSEVTLVFTNNDQNPLPGHNWVLEGIDGAATDVINNGETTEVTFMAPPPGDYAFFCSVGDHRDQGMEGTFTVAA